MIGTSLSEYALIRVSVTFIRSITPLSFLYCLAAPFLPSVSPLFAIYPASECLFYFLVFLPKKRKKQLAAVHPQLVPRSERQILFDRCLKTVPDANRYLEKWFCNAPLQDIKRENVKDFFQWAFLNGLDGDEGELDGYVDSIETKVGRELESGRGPAECLRLTTDEVDMRHRPWVWYSIVGLVDTYTHLRLSYNFTYTRLPRLSSFWSVFPFRPLTLLAKQKSIAPKLSYWHRPHSSNTRTPILFIHGIGIGLMPYCNFLEGLDPEVGIIALELLPISFRITWSELEQGDMCRQITAILDSCGPAWQKFALVTHSYGTVITIHLLRTPSIASRIDSVTLIDPVSLLLHLPDVAYNFIRRSPRRANELQLWYFACKDMCVAHTLSRRFFWADNILWIEDLREYRDRAKLTVVLGERDCIVDTWSVRRYLEDGGVKVVWCRGLDHAQVFDDVAWRRVLVEEVNKTTLK